MAGIGGTAFATEREGASGRWIVRARGQIDLHSAQAFRKALVDCVDAGASDLLVDLTGVEYIDSVGLGVLVGVWKKLRLRNGELAVVTADATIRRVFELAALPSTFAIYGPPADVAQQG